MTTSSSVHDSLITLLDQQRLQPVFQPIVDTHQHRLLGHESLIRGPAAHPLEFPVALFDEAKQAGLLSELDLSCRQLAMQAYCQLQMSGLLFINVDPNLLLDKQHPKGCTQRMAQTLGIPANNIVIELSEQYPILDPAGLKIAVEHYRSLGFLIAIDDLGTGYSGLKLWSEVKPDYVKIDRYFIQELHQNPIKREFVQSIVTLARGLQSQVIAEGIETEAELQQLQQMGVYLCQGYYLGRPKPMPLLQAPRLDTKQSPPLAIQQPENVAALAHAGVTVDIEDTLQQVFDMLLKNERLQSLPVLAQQTPVGMLRRVKVMELFSDAYVRSLYANKSVRHAMDTPVVMDWQTSLENASSLITLDDTDDADSLSHFIITRQGHYDGLASIHGLLRNITEQRLQHTHGKQAIG
ncbi:EAL domain-containing protein [Oceanisphaera ostreae]|uniref:EAL domain-containing protein n=1 Tax=Oceanisphaera ostreae TaxID=914151 RepID=A0ABW3KF26_9GAMM